MNPINYANGLVTELGFAQQNKDKVHEAGVREQLTWVSDQLDRVNPEPLSDHTRELWEAAKSAVADALADKPKRAVKATTATTE
jgi:maltose-binding protein MalE